MAVVLDPTQKWKGVEYFLEFYEANIGVDTQEIKKKLKFNF